MQMIRTCTDTPKVPQYTKLIELETIRYTYNKIMIFSYQVNRNETIQWDTTIPPAEDLKLKRLTTLSMGGNGWECRVAETFTHSLWE